MAEEMLSSKSFHNHIKLGLGYLFTKDLLVKFVSEDTIEFVKLIITNINNQSGVKECRDCGTSNVLECPTNGICNLRSSSCRYHSGTSREHRVCRNDICYHFKNSIKSVHQTQPAWSNTDARGWCTSPVEVAKCFMPEKGYDRITSFDKIDFHGIISVVINNKRFRNKLLISLPDIRELLKRNNEFRHSATLSVEEDVLKDSLDSMIALLEDPKYLYGMSTATVEELRKLKTDTFEISSNEITEVLTDAIKNIESDAVENVIEQKEQTLRLLNELQKQFKEKSEIVTAHSLAEIIGTKMRAIFDLTEHAKRLETSISRTGNKEQRKLTKQAEKIRRSLELEEPPVKEGENIPRPELDGNLIKDFRDELIEFYKEEHKYLPISPMIDSNKAPLLDFYVNPTMYYIDVEKQPFRNEEFKFSQPVKSYDDIFTKDKQHCKNIYLTSRAGCGKTCFSKRMTLAWCQAWKHDAMVRERFEIENVDAMANFSFLFLISLRECRSKECDIDEIIQNQLISKLSKESKYKQIIQSLLSSEDCLVLIDGLDEWSHPTKKKKRCKDFKSKIPHRKFGKHLTYITTSRLWKFHSITGEDVKVDQHVEMTGLENESALLLANNVITHLNNRSGQTKSSRTFEDMLESKDLKNFIRFPLILMQLLCLWYDDKDPGESKCQIFSNMLELLFRHAKKRTNFEEKFKHLPHAKGKRSNKKLPSSFSAAPICQKYQQMLYALSKLAYETMFGESFDNKLVFYRSIVDTYLTESEFLLCLETGILLQSKETGHLTSEDLNYSFLHKMFHELLAALFISSKTDLPKAMLPKITRKFNSIDDILRLDMFLVFLSGFSPNVTKDLTENFVTILSPEKMTARYRSNIGTIFIKDSNRMQEMSDLMLSCAQEICCNQPKAEVNVYLEDIFIDKKCAENTSKLAMKNLIACNKDTMKSLYVHMHQTVHEDEIGGIMSEIDICSINSLDKLFVWGNIESSDVNCLLENSKKSLRVLELWNLDFSRKQFPELQMMDQVSGLSLMSLKLSHSQICDLMKYIAKSEVLQHMNLNKIDCSDHGTSCTGYDVVLCPKAKPHLLVFDKLVATSVSFNAELLQMCVVEWLSKEGALESLLTYLEREPSSLKRFECDHAACESDTEMLIATVPKFVNLNYFRLRNIKIGGNALNLSGMKALMRIHIWHSSMTASVLRCIVDDLESLAQSVIVILDDCDISPSEEEENVREENVREYVKKSKRFKVIKEETHKKYKLFHFKTLTIQT